MLKQVETAKPEVEIVDVSIGLKIQTNIYEVHDGNRRYIDLGFFPVKIPLEKILALLSDQEKEKLMEEARQEYKSEVSMFRTGITINKD